MEINKQKMDFIKRILLEADNVMEEIITDPSTGEEMFVVDALELPDESPLKKQALKLVQKSQAIKKPIKSISAPNKVKKQVKQQKPAPTKVLAPNTSNKSQRSHKPKSKSYGISKEAVEFLKSKGLTQLNVLPQSFVTIDQIQLNPEIETKGKDAVWVAKFPVILPNGKQSYKLAYTRNFMKKSQSLKYKKIAKIKEKDITSLEEKTDKLLKSKNQVIADASCVIAIILKTGLRVGSKDSDSEDSTGNLGVRTLRKENISIKGDKITLNFIGKSYQENVAVFNSQSIASYLKMKLVSLKDMDNIFSCSYGQVNALMEQINPKGINPKDLRTYKATEFAKKLLQSKELGAPPPLPENPKEIKKTVKEKLLKVFTAVSQLLNNSPTMARNSYVNPVVITSWLHSLGLQPQTVGYKHITLESLDMVHEGTDFLSMDQMFSKYKDDGTEMTDDVDALMEDINHDLGLSNDESNEEYYDCEEYEIPEWFFDPNVELVKVK